MAHKHTENKKRTHSEKVLTEMSKKVNKPVSPKSQTVGAERNFREQYELIRNDIMKLREDIHKGYDIAKGMAEKNSLFGKFLKSK